MSGGFFRGTSADQDTRFSNKQAKLLKSQKFAPELENLVDMTKVKLDVMKPWIAKRVTELIGFEDEVLINFIYGLLEEKRVDGKHVQISLTGFMERNTGKFMKELWALLLSAEQNVSGVPQQFLDAKEEETKRNMVETDRIANEIQRKKEKEMQEIEQEKKKMGGDGARSRDQRSELELNLRNDARGSSIKPAEEKDHFKKNGRRHGSERRRSRSISGSPPSRSRSISSEKRYRSSPQRRHISRRSPSPRRRSPYSRRRSPSHSRRRSPSPSRYRSRHHRSRSPLHRRSRTPIKRSSLRYRSRTPIRKRTPSPVRRRSPSPKRGISLSPLRGRSPSPKKGISLSTVRRRSPSPKRGISVSPVRRRSPSPKRGISVSPVRRSPSPKNGISVSPVRRRSPSPKNGISVSPVRRSPSPEKEISLSPDRVRSPSPARRRRSPSPLRRRRSPSPLRRRRSPSPLRRRRSPSPVRRRRSPSPVRRRRSPSPMRRRRSPSPMRRRRSPARRRYQHSPSVSPVHHRYPMHGEKRSSTARSPQELSSPSDIRRSSHSPVVRGSGKSAGSPIHSRGERARRHGKYSPARRTSPKERIGVPDEKGTRVMERSPLVSLRSPQRETLSEGDISGKEQELSPPLANASQGKHYTEERSPHTRERMVHPEDSNPLRKAAGDKPHRESSGTSGDDDDKLSSREIGEYKNRSVGKNSPTSRAQRDSFNSSEVRGLIHDTKSQKTQPPSREHRKRQELSTTSKGMESIPELSSKSEHNGLVGDSDSPMKDTEGEGVKVKEKRKHKRSHRKEIESDGYSSYDSQERREAKKRKKEEKKIKKEERRRRRDDRRHRRDKNHGEKQSEDETESEQKRLEIELREKALESLRAKKGIGN